MILCQKNAFFKALCVLGSFAPIYAFGEQDTNQFREHAILQIRAGKVEQGLASLRNLHLQNPNEQKLLADYWMISSQQNALSKTEEVRLYSHLQLKNFPSYAYLTVIHSLRDHKQFQKALYLSQQFNRISPSLDLQLLQGVLYAELNNRLMAIQQLKSLHIQQMSADQLSMMSYAYGLIDMKVDQLNNASAAYHLAPQKKAIQAQYIQALLQMGSYKEADSIIQRTAIAQTYPQLKTAFLLGEFSQNIKDAISRSKFLFDQGEPESQSYAYLDEVLAAASAIEVQLVNNREADLRFNYDYIYALNARGRSHDVIATFERLNVKMLQIPAYARQAIAESYLNTKRAVKAEIWYKSLLNERHYPDMSMYSGLYYAYLEQEKYIDAGQLLQDIDAKVARFQYSNAAGVDRSPTSDREEYILLKGMHLAYSNRLEEAENYYRTLLKFAPNNSAYLNNLAIILRWRQQPLAAQALLARLNNIQPVEKVVQVNLAEVDQALGNIQSWHAQLKPLQQDYPQDTSVIEDTKQWNDRSHASISYQTDFGQSHSNQIAQSLKGSQDRSAELHVNSPWINDNYRIFALHQDLNATFKDGAHRDQRYGLGLEWASKRKDLTIAITQNTQQQQTGVNIGWSQWLNDHWQYALGYASKANIPLQALSENIDGVQYSASMLWQQNESRNVKLTYQTTRISDSNQQQSWLLNYSQNLFLSAHHQTQVMLSNYYGQNSHQNLSYFSPKNEYGTDVTFTHDWITWRKYNQQFTQHFEVGMGTYHQAEFSNKPTWNVQYAHQWALSRTWQLNYGIGVSVHAYDGDNERRVYGLFGFQGIF